jgi:REP-associated tyrosine transposase
MVDYRRNRVPGGTYFFTVALLDRRSRLLVEQASALRDCVREARRSRPFDIDALVVLPDHLHAVWTLPTGDDDYSGRLRAIKSLFSGRVVKAGVDVPRNAKGEYALWQRRYWEHTVRDERDFARHVDYIHFNPVKHELVKRAVDWPLSSFHRYVRIGLLPPDWAGSAYDGGANGFGE